MSQAPAPSGKQFLLQLGRQTAVVTEVGGGLRSYCVGERELLDGYAVDQMCTGARGQTFVPWPNRIAGGRYRFAGVEHQLPLTEPAAGNAIHGLTRWASWHAVHSNHQSLRLQHTVHPQPGYPFALKCELTYRLVGAGLAVETRTTNTGAGPAPYATGAHPYLAAGSGGTIDELTVCVPAATWLPTDDRGIPTGRQPVEGTDRDLRRPGRLGDRVLDTAFTDLTRDPDGGTSVLVGVPGAPDVEVWLDAAYGWVELFTGDTLPDEGRRRRGLGIEPMTAAPDAFNSAEGLVVLDPGEVHTARWELRPEIS
jgi:aldose 1-epimerase